MTLPSFSRSARRMTATGLLSALTLSLAACTQPRQPQATTLPVLPTRVALLTGDSAVLNYTPWYIHTWELAGPPGSDIGGGGANVMPVHEDGRPSGGTGMCCMSIPHEWQPAQTYTVRWLVFKDVKKLGAKTPGYWYKAENVRFAKYDGHEAGDIWAIFLPGDRVRLMVGDGNTSGGNDLNHRPSDSDPYIAQGVRDDEWNRLYPNGDAQ